MIPLQLIHPLVHQAAYLLLLAHLVQTELYLAHNTRAVGVLLETLIETSACHDASGLLAEIGHTYQGAVLDGFAFLLRLGFSAVRGTFHLWPDSGGGFNGSPFRMTPYRLGGPVCPENGVIGHGQVLGLVVLVLQHHLPIRAVQVGAHHRKEHTLQVVYPEEAIRQLVHHNPLRHVDVRVRDDHSVAAIHIDPLHSGMGYVGVGPVQLPTADIHRHSLWSCSLLAEIHQNLWRLTGWTVDGGEEDLALQGVRPEEVPVEGIVRQSTHRLVTRPLDGLLGHMGGSIGVPPEREDAAVLVLAIVEVNQFLGLIECEGGQFVELVGGGGYGLPGAVQELDLGPQRNSKVWK